MFYAALFLTAALLGTRTLYDPISCALVVVIYLGLGLLLHGVAQVTVGFSPQVAPISALAIATLVLWQFREQFRVPETWLAFGLLTCLAAVAVAWLERRLHDRWPVAALLPTIVGAAVFVLAVALAWTASETARWHLLRHNTLIGTPLYYLAAAPVPATRQTLFDRHRAPDLAPPVGDEPAADTSRTETRGRSSGPHIVWLMVDTLRADSLAAWRRDPVTETDRAPRMPYLDALAARSLRFTDVLANSSWTRPSIASMITGLLPEEHGARDLDDPLLPELETIAEILHSRGYETTAFVTNVGAAGREAGFAQGFDTFLEIDATPYARADHVNQRVEAFLQQWLESSTEERRRPQLLYLHYLDPHDPYLSSEPPRRPTPEEYRRAYDAELEYFDRSMAALLPKLLEGLGDDTVVVLSSDHGEEFFEHGLFGHGHSLYDEVVHVPLFVHHAAMQDGAALSQRLEGRDLFSLLLALEERADLGEWAIERCRDERYLSLYYTGTGRLILRPYRRYNVMRSLDRESHRFIWSAYGETRELYEHGTDPDQLRNLIGAAPELAGGMERVLDDFPQHWRFPPPIEPSERALEQLRELGYVE